MVYAFSCPWISTKTRSVLRSCTGGFVARYYRRDSSRPGALGGVVPDGGLADLGGEVCEGADGGVEGVGGEGWNGGGGEEV